MNKSLSLISAVLFLALPAFAQTGGFYSGVAATQSPGNILRLLPNAPVVVCSYPGTGGTPCTNKATTYTDATLATSCSSTSQVVVPGTNVCSASTDSAANFGFYVTFGNYTYWFQDGTVWKGPFTATIGGAGNGSITGVLPTVGGGLTGGGTSGSLSLGLLNTCSPNQILQWNGSAWACSNAGTGTVTSVSGGTGLSGTVTTSGSLSIASSYQLPQSCSTNQLAQWNGSNWNTCLSLSAYSLVVSNTPLTTAGDLLTIIAGALARLPQGANGTYLGVSGGTLGYSTPSGTGTVTHTVGANGLNFPVVGNSGADIQTLDVATNKYQDIPTSGAPSNPSAGNLRFYGNSSSGGFLACLTSSGASCFPTNVPLGTSAQFPVMNSGATAYVPQTMGGDGTINNSGSLTVTKTNGTAFTGAATMALPVSNTNGGTGLNTSSSTGVPQINSGTWSVSTTLPSGLSATNMTLAAPALGTPASGNAANLTNLPLGQLNGETNGQIIAGIAGAWAGTTALPNGVTATTQTAGDSTTKVATDAFVLANAVTNPMTTLGDTAPAGVGGAFTRVAGPTAPSIPFAYTEIPSGGLATAPFWNKLGLSGRTVNGSSDTILGSDDAHFVNYCNNGGSAGPPCTTATAVAVTLPTAGTGCGTASDFCQNFVTILIAGPGLVTVTTATSTINGNSTTTYPFQMQNQVCRFNTPDNANWTAHCWDDNSAQPVNTDTGSANAYVSACPGVAPPLQIGDKCAFQAAHQSTGASTLNASSTGIVNITRMGGAALQSADILASPSITYVIYDGTEWALLNPQGAASGISATAANPLTASGTSTAVSSPAWFSLSYAGYQDAGGDACKTLYNALTVLPPGAWIEDDLPAGRLKCTQNPFTANLSSAQNPAVFTGIMYSTNPHAFYMSGSSTWILPLGFSWKGAGFSGLAGDGSRGTALIACNATSNGSVCPGAFSNDTPMIAWITSATSGASGVGAGKDTALWNMTIDCNYVQGCRGLQNYAGQENAGANYVQVQDYCNNGIGLDFGNAGGGAASQNSSYNVLMVGNASGGTGSVPACTFGSLGIRMTYGTNTLSGPKSIKDLTVSNYYAGNPTGAGTPFNYPYHNVEVNGSATSWDGQFHDEYHSKSGILQGTQTLLASVNTQNATSGACAGDCVTWVSGDQWGTGASCPATVNIGTGDHCTVATGSGNCAASTGTQTAYTVSSCQSTTLLTLSTAPGTQSDVPFSGDIVGGGALNQHFENITDCCNSTDGSTTTPSAFETNGNSASGAYDIGELQTTIGSGVPSTNVIVDGFNSTIARTTSGTNTRWLAGYKVDANNKVLLDPSGTNPIYFAGNVQASAGVDLLSAGTVSSEGTTAAGTYTVGRLTCVTATHTFGDCTSAANNQAFIGVNLAKDGATTPNWATAGTVTANSVSATTFTAGDYVCTDASNAALVADNGTTPCPNPQRQVGIVPVTSSPSACAPNCPHTILLIFSAQAGSAGGSGTVNSGTASHLAYYASSTTAVSDMGADFVFATHTLSTATTAIFDTSAQTGVASLKFPAVAGGTSLAGTDTATLSSPITLVNSNSSNNNTSVGAIIGAAGSSTGGVGLLVYDVSGTGNILDVYSGGSQASGVYTPGTLEANITAAGGATFQGTVNSASLLATGIVDGTAPITITSGTTANLGTTYKSGYTFNQEATAGTGVTYTLPATAVGLQYCVRNSIVSGSGAPDTGVLTVYPPASSYVILNGTINTIGGGGTHGVASGGAAGDSACFVAIDSTHWEVFVIRGTWTAN